MLALKQLLNYFVCLLLSITLSSYLLISSLVFTNNFVYSSPSSGKIFEQVLEIPVKKSNNEFSCGYLKFISSSSHSDKVLKNILQQIPFITFSYCLFEPPRTASFLIQHLIFSGNPPPDKCVLNCSFQIWFFPSSFLVIDSSIIWICFANYSIINTWQD